MKYITDLEGVFASAVASKIRGDQSDQLDLGYLYIPNSTACSIKATRNHFRAPCVDFSVGNAKKNPKLLIVNSGNANAATGKKGYEDVLTMASLGEEFFSLKKEEVLIASTGIIGVNLPIGKIQKSFPELSENKHSKAGDLLATAILTTDTVEKFSCAESVVSSNQKIKVAGIAKGSGMIAPNMGTMFAFIVINVPLDFNTLDKLTTDAVNDTFNMMSVDTDTSTNDMVMVFANEDKDIVRPLDDEIINASGQLIKEVCLSLSKQIARDGEGASKLLVVTVKGAKTGTDARLIAKSVSDSPLVKTAVHGADPNWGRVLMAIGKVPDAQIEPSLVKISFGSYVLFENGEPKDFNHDLLRQYLLEDTVNIKIELGVGKEDSESYGCDLTKGYIDINTCYN